MPTNPCTPQTQKTFTIETIKELNNKNNTQKQNLLLKLYLNFLLLSEVLEEEQECEVTFEQYGFFVNNQHKIEFKEYCFLNANNNLYRNILYRFRNSIAHGEFSILEDEITFCNSHGGVNFKARISMDKIDELMEFLKGKVVVDD